MANPIFGRGEKFATQQTYPPQGYAQQGYAPQYQQPGYQQPQYAPPAMGGVMTYDDVIAKTAISLGGVFVVAALTFMFAPINLLMPMLIGSAILGFVTVLIVGFRRTVSPVALGIYALFEGVFVGAVSKFFEFMWPGIVASAVFATFVTAGVTLAVMKFGNIRVSHKFRQGVMIATIAFAGVMLINLLLAVFGVNTGLREIGPEAGLLSMGVSLLAIVLAVFNLVEDFDSVRRGVEAGAPASESWRAALGITVTMVWLYVEILRILSYFQRD